MLTEKTLYSQDLDAETLRWLADELKEHAESVRQWEERVMAEVQEVSDG